MKKVLHFLILLLFLNYGHAQNACEQKTSAHLRLVGDSWMHFPALYDAYDSALAKYGFPDYYSLSDGSALISMTAETWWQNPIAHNALWSALHSDFNKPIDIVMVSLGGNDVPWLDERDSLDTKLPAMYRVKLFMDSIFGMIHNLEPDAQIIWQCYDYPNFNDLCMDNPWDPYCDDWNSHGNSTAWQLNRFTNFATNFFDSVTQSYNLPYMHFFNALGLMQWHYGQEPALRYPPYISYPPRSVPFPGGLWDCPSPHVAMGLNGLDAYHLSPDGFTVVADFYLRKFISNYLRRDRDTTAHSEGSNKDGWVRSDNQTGTGEIQVAKSGSVITKGIISFNTNFIPADKNVTRASLFIKNKTIARKYPLSNVFPSFYKLDIKNGTFGNDEVESTDFSAPASAYDIACVAGNLRGNEYTLRFDLRDDALQYINKTGTTQFRVEITDENFINFYNGDTAEFEGPYLDLYYENAVPTSVLNHEVIDQTLKVYPNPAINDITLQLNQEWQNKGILVNIYDTRGAIISSVKYGKITNHEIKTDISSLAEGGYFISIEGGENKSVGTFVKMKK